MTTEALELLAASLGALAALQNDNEERRCEGGSERWPRTIAKLEAAISKIQEADKKGLATAVVKALASGAVAA